ncbi:MAG: AEC family transporter [Opitutales bacterium]
MVSLPLILNALLPIVGLLAAGWFFRQRGWLTPASESGLMQLTVRLFFPALIFRHVLDNEALGEPLVLFEAVGTGVLSIALGMVISLLMAPLFGIREGRARRTFAVVAGVFNYGYLALPLARDLYGSETVGVMLAVNAGVEAPIWSLGLLLLYGKFSPDSWKRALSPPLLALLIAAPLNLMGGKAWMPVFFLNFLDWAGPCAIPMGILLTGSTFRTLYEEHGRSVMADLRPMWAGYALRLGLLPALMVLAAVLLPLSVHVQRVLLIHAAMPCGIFPVVLARHYGGDAPKAFLVVGSTCLAGIVTLPLWLQLGAWLLAR